MISDDPTLTIGSDACSVLPIYLMSEIGTQDHNCIEEMDTIDGRKVIFLWEMLPIS